MNISERVKLIKSKKFVYQMMAPGKCKKVRIFGMGIVDVEWRVPYFSDSKVILAASEELACAEIRQKVKKQWTGFFIFEDPSKPEMAS